VPEQDEDTNQPGQAGNGFDVDIRTEINKTFDSIGKTLDDDKSTSIVNTSGSPISAEIEDLLMGSFPIPKSPTETIIKRFKAGEFKTKKQAILAYVDTFGLDGARYTDIIKFAFDLNYGVGLFRPTTNRGYYACAFSLKDGGHLIRPGIDGNYLVKPVKKRYYTNDYVSDVGVDVIENYLAEPSVSAILERMIELNELEALTNKK
jgi:hypothetical protein